MESLLGQFYNRIKGSQELIASDGLNYILQRSEAAQKTIRNIIQNECGIELDSIVFSSQNTGEKGERPDISGYDGDGKEVIIIETKFWSSLTENQPQEYLTRLKGNSVLLFISPNLRVRTLYSEIIRRVNPVSNILNSNNERHSITCPDSKFILIISWKELLDALKINLSRENNRTLLSDLDQIIGYCEIIDKNSFLPLQSEELSPQIAQRMNSYCDLIDNVVAELNTQGKFITKGLQATGQRWGYTRYGRINNFSLALNLDFDFWAKNADTPFWLGVHLRLSDKKDWAVPKSLEQICRKVAIKFHRSIALKENKIPCFPLFPLINETQNLVIKNIGEQIISLINELNKEMIKSNQ
jgi:hypothetical protein